MTESRIRNLLYLSYAFDLVLIGALVLWLMGHPLICKCGYVKLWHGVPNSAENSQHIADWYTFSHVIHGFLFYGLYRLVVRAAGARGNPAAGFLMATFIEVAWEIAENTPWIIGRYREATIALDYFGDSVLNSVSDVAAMMIGFLVASRLPAWATVALALAMELVVGAIIRDNLTLNVIMLLYPLDAIKAWQSGG